MNIMTNIIKMVVNMGICISDDRESICLEHSGSVCIAIDSSVCIVRIAIYFDNY